EPPGTGPRYGRRRRAGSLRLRSQANWLAGSGWAEPDRHVPDEAADLAEAGLLVADERRDRDPQLQLVTSDGGLGQGHLDREFPRRWLAPAPFGGQPRREDARLSRRLDEVGHRVLLVEFEPFGQGDGDHQADRVAGRCPDRRDGDRPRIGE